VDRLSLKKLLETLASFGFKKSDARIYVFLAKNGPRTARDLETALKMPRWQIYKSLRNLRVKRAVTSILHRPAIFSAISFEKVVDIAAKAKIEEAEQDRASTDQAILYWEKMMKENSNSTHELQAEEEKEVKNK
jgi:sugar-specific transcriptional regulator TrmB